MTSPHEIERPHSTGQDSAPARFRAGAFVFPCFAWARVMWNRRFGVGLLAFLVLWTVTNVVFASECGELLEGGLSGEGQWETFYGKCLDGEEKVKRYARRTISYFEKRVDGAGHYASHAHISELLEKMQRHNLSKSDMCRATPLIKSSGKRKNWEDKIGCKNYGTGFALKRELNITIPEDHGWMKFFIFLLVLSMGYGGWFLWKLNRRVENVEKHSTEDRKREADIACEYLKEIQNHINALSDAVKTNQYQIRNIQEQIRNLQGLTPNQKAIPELDKKTGWDALYKKLLAADTFQEINRVLDATEAEYHFKAGIGTVGRPRGKEGLYSFDRKIMDGSYYELYVILCRREGTYDLIPCGIRNKVTNPLLNLLYRVDKDNTAIQRLKSPTQIRVDPTDRTTDNMIYFSLEKMGELL